MSPTDNSNRFVPYVDIYFHIYFIAGITFQSILLFLIFKKSPAYLHDFKIFLCNTTLFQILNIFCAYFIQYRALPNSTTLAILSRGPCMRFGAEACFANYHIFVGISSSVAMSISATIVFRYFLLKNWKPLRRLFFFMILFSHLPPAIATIIPFLSEWNFSIVRKQTYSEHPSYDLSIYEPFPGFADIQSLSFLTVTTMIAIGAYCVPLVSIFIIHQIWNITNIHSHLSQHTKNQTTTLLKGLAIQVLFPILSYIPIITVYIYSQVSHQEVLFVEHLLNIMTCFPSLVDPFVSFYFIIPYRIAILQYLHIYKPPPIHRNHLTTLHPSVVGDIRKSSIIVMT